MKTDAIIPEWKTMLLRNAEDFRYAVTLTMNQAYKSDKTGNWIADPQWVRLDENIASQELTRFRHKLNDEIYDSNWPRRLLSRGKPNGLYMIATTHGRSERGLGRYWNRKNADFGGVSERIDADGEIHSVSTGAQRQRLQNIHYHCFIDRDLSCRWDNDTRSMVEARDIFDMTRLIRRLWNQMAFGAEIDRIEVQDIYENDGKHAGWANYIEGQMWDADGYDINNTILRK